MEMWRIRLWTPEHPSREMVTCRELGGDGRERERERESECVCVYVCVCVCVCVPRTEDRKTIVDSGVLGESDLERDN